MHKTPFPFHQFNSPVHQAWKRDRLRRQRVPLHESWRGCVGLAMLWRNVDRGFECHGDKIFYDNDNLYWACLRDVPPGHFPDCPRKHRRPVIFGSLANASLKHGMPFIDFSERTPFAWDLANMPFGTVITGTNGHTCARMAAGDVLNSDEHPRKFAVFTRLTTAMTEFAAISDGQESSETSRNCWTNSRIKVDRSPVRAPIRTEEARECVAGSETDASTGAIELREPNLNVRFFNEPHFF